MNTDSGDKSSASILKVSLAGGRWSFTGCSWNVFHGVSGKFSVMHFQRVRHVNASLCQCSENNENADGSSLKQLLERQFRHNVDTTEKETNANSSESRYTGDKENHWNYRFCGHMYI